MPKTINENELQAVINAIEQLKDQLGNDNSKRRNDVESRRNIAQYTIEREVLIQANSDSKVMAERALNQIKELQNKLYILRRDLAADRISENIEPLKKSTHNALVALTRVAPRNSRTDIAHEVQSTITGYVIPPALQVPLSNGCIYSSVELDNELRDKKKLPTILKGSEREIDNYDLAEAQKFPRMYNVNKGANYGMVVGILAAIVAPLVAKLAIGFALDAALIGAFGITAMTATILSAGIFVLGVLAFAAVGALAGYLYYRNHYANELRNIHYSIPVSSTGKKTLDFLGVRDESAFNYEVKPDKGVGAPGYSYGESSAGKLKERETPQIVDTVISRTTDKDGVTHEIDLRHRSGDKLAESLLAQQPKVQQPKAQQPKAQPRTPQNFIQPPLDEKAENVDQIDEATASSPNLGLF